MIIEIDDNADVDSAEETILRGIRDIIFKSGRPEKEVHCLLYALMSLLEPDQYEKFLRELDECKDL